ncbi:GGDEF domain-containing protein [Occallatibacter riparius]|uniref:GGDEF domain-containing protein n=1 Tax=Occallatibacter riparius TaxID=1002689 RepID=A0A9J7BL20_9BACT|nr:GGDEF domain-containing protein [Occallatibacter riparius]UWZ83335.1 GGDEF domain-containing protein [Occallatibacter riparius]
MDWSKLPDLIAVGLLAWAFASVARNSPTRVSAHWLTAWLLIVLHFFTFMLVPLRAPYGDVADYAGVLALIWAGILFMRASVPYRHENSSLLMLMVVLSTYTLYTGALMSSAPKLITGIAAVLLGLAPVAVALIFIREFTHPLRWLAVGLQAVLAALLLFLQNRPNGADLSLNAVLFTVYLGAASHFWYMYRRASTGAIITIVGFFLWASVFLVSPLIIHFKPQLPLDGEVWNLPKYVAAVGMILVLLEDQIAHSKHLALHDPLTGLPNRRLFHDRLSSALERARRSEEQVALLIIDLDRFKQVNDTLGHHVGDLLLQEVARMFSGRVRRSDTVARTGGDEFAIILEGPTNRSEAKLVGRTLVKLLEQPIRLESRMVTVDASMGLAIFPDDAVDEESLCIRADLRMYDFKRTSAAETRFSPKPETPPSHPAQLDNETAIL